MTLDKERLRVLAEAALSAQASSDWVTHAAEFESNTTPDVVLELLSENAALAAEVERLEREARSWQKEAEINEECIERQCKDAARYRWLRD